jgi:hypothetical protein
MGVTFRATDPPIPRFLSGLITVSVQIAVNRGARDTTIAPAVIQQDHGLTPFHRVWSSGFVARWRPQVRDSPWPTGEPVGRTRGGGAPPADPPADVAANSPPHPLASSARGCSYTFPQSSISAGALVWSSQITSAQHPLHAGGGAPTPVRSLDEAMTFACPLDATTSLGYTSGVTVPA